MSRRYKPIYFRQDGKTYRFDPNVATKLGSDQWDPKSGNENRRWTVLWKTPRGRYVAHNVSIYQDEHDWWCVLDEREALELLSEPGMSLTGAGEDEREMLAEKFGEEL